MRQVKIMDRCESIFGIRYQLDGEMVMFKMSTTSPLAEYKARQLLQTSAHPVEVWHFPKYGHSIKLCTVIK